MVKRLPAMWETRVRSLGREDPLEKEMATHSSTLAWKIPWTEEPGKLQSMGLHRVGHDWATSLHFHKESNCACVWKAGPPEWLIRGTLCGSERRRALPQRLLPPSTPRSRWHCTSPGAIALTGKAIGLKQPGPTRLPPRCWRRTWTTRLPPAPQSGVHVPLKKFLICQPCWLALMNKAFLAFVLFWLRMWAVDSVFTS